MSLSLSVPDSSGQIMTASELAATAAFAFAVYWLWSLMFLALDTLGLLQPYKLKPTRSRGNLTVLVPSVIRDQVPFLPAAAIVHACYGFRVQAYEGPAAVLKFLAFAWLLQRVSFYYLHRLFHTRWLYRLVHYQHHRWTRPTALVTASAHPVENIVLNAWPVLWAIALGQPDPVGLYLFVFWAVTRSCWDHSGYAFPVFSDAGHHDMHHLCPFANFGPAWIDKLHGTFLAP